jgi:hypothetical protein
VQRTIRTVASLVAHESEVALVGLDNRWRFQVVFVKAVNDFVKCSNVVVE